MIGSRLQYVDQLLLLLEEAVQLFLYFGHLRLLGLQLVWDSVQMLLPHLG